jgi:type II secretory pathway pseudopilin PulG
MRLIFPRLNARGDTLVEVLLSTVIISIVLAGAFALSNRSLRVNQTAAERTEVVNKMREQVETLRFLSENRDVAAWNDVENIGDGDEFYIQLFATDGDPDTAPISDYDNTGLIHDYNGGNDSYGVADIFNIWVVPDFQAEYFDFTVHGQWEGIGSVGPQKAGLVLRVNR